jgi:hypothetical protein
MIEIITVVLEIVLAIEISKGLNGKRARARDLFIRAKRTLINWIKNKLKK